MSEYDMERDLKAAAESGVRPAMPKAPEFKPAATPPHIPLTKQLEQALDDMQAAEKRMRQILEQIRRVKTDVL